MSDKTEIARIVSRVGELPAMPAVVAQVLRVTDDPASDMSAVSAAIQSDPALTAKILRVSNSPYYGMKQYVGTLKLALVILGVREVRNIVLGISVFEAVRDSERHVEAVHEIWNTSLRVAGMAKSLGLQLGLDLQGEEFIAGLLTDIGKVALLRQRGGAYLGLLEECRNDDLTLRQRERQALGCTHEEVAMTLAALWNLPQTLCDALWYQYPDPEHALRDAVDPALAAVVRIAKAACGDDFSQDGGLRSLDDAEAWQALTGVRAPLAPGERKQVLGRNMEILSRAPAIPL